MVFPARDVRYRKRQSAPDVLVLCLLSWLACAARVAPVQAQADAGAEEVPEEEPGEAHSERPSPGAEAEGAIGGADGSTTIDLLPSSVPAEGPRSEQWESLEEAPLPPLPDLDDLSLNELPARPTSIQVLDRDDIQRSGAINLRDLLSQLTSNAGAADTLALGISARMGVDSAAAFNLRGMGGGATLVLLNDRRIVSSASPVRDGTDTDINAIPLAVVERIEVQRGGASARYGSNAIAGVINIVTRKDYAGVHVDARGGSTSRFDHQVAHASFAMGTVSDRAAVQVGAGYAFQNGLANTDRDFTRTIQQTSLFGSPGSFVGLDPDLSGTANLSERPLIAYPDPRCGAPDQPNSFQVITPADSPETRASKARHSGLSEAQLVEEFQRAGTGDGRENWLTEVCRYNFNPYLQLISPIERFNAFGSGSFEVAPRMTAFAEVLTSRTQSEPITPPSYPANNLDLLLPPSGTAASNHPEQVRWLGRPIGSGPATRNRQLQESFRAVVGLRGDIATSSEGGSTGDWHWETAVSLSLSYYDSAYRDALNDQLYRALDGDCRPDDPDPGAPRACLDTTAEQTAAYRESLQPLFNDQTSETASTLMTWDAQLTGPLLTLPAGPLGAALFVEARREARTSIVDEAAKHQYYTFLYGSGPQDESRRIGAAGLELDVPIFRWMLGQLAGRAESYSGLNTYFSPKVGFLINVGEMLGSDAEGLRNLHFRATFTRGVVAPTLVASANATRALPSPQRYKRKPVMIPNDVVGNPNLSVEQANALSAGLDTTFLDLVSAAIDFYYYDYRDAVIADDARRIVRTCADDPDNDTCEIILPLDDIGLLPTRVVSHYRNAGAYQTSGLDFELEGRIPFGLPLETPSGAFRRPALYLGITGTYLLFYRLSEEVYVPNPDPNSNSLARAQLSYGDVAGKRNYQNSAPALPRLRMRIPVGLRWGGHDVRLVGRFIDGFRNDELVDQPPYDGDLDPNETGRDFDPQLTLDVGYGFTTRSLIGEQTTLRVDVTNLLDRLPQRRYTADGTDLSVYDPRGRMILVSLSQDF